MCPKQAMKSKQIQSCNPLMKDQKESSSVNNSTGNSLLFLPAGETGCFLLMSHGEGPTHYRKCCFMVYCSQITDLLIVMSIYNHLFSISGFGERKSREDRWEKILYLQNYPHISKLTGLWNLKAPFRIPIW